MVMYVVDGTATVNDEATFLNSIDVKGQMKFQRY